MQFSISHVVVVVTLVASFSSVADMYGRMKRAEARATAAEARATESEECMNAVVEFAKKTPRERGAVPATVDRNTIRWPANIPLALRNSSE